MTAGGLHFGTETEAFRFQGKEHYPEKRVVIGRKRPLQADQRPKLDGAGQEPLKKLSLLGWNSSGELPGLKKTTSGGTPVPSPQVWVVEPIEAAAWTPEVFFTWSLPWIGSENGVSHGPTFNARYPVVPNLGFGTTGPSKPIHHLLRRYLDA